VRLLQSCPALRVAMPKAYTIEQRGQQVLFKNLR
jgi:hypothetical protein